MPPTRAKTMTCPCCNDDDASALYRAGHHLIVECARQHRFVLAFDEKDLTVRWLTIATADNLGFRDKSARFRVDPPTAEF